MARGGKRDGAGRKASSLTHRTRAIAEGIALSGNETPLEVILKLMRNAATDEDKLKAAIAAAPYVHPRLAAIEASVEINKHEEAVKSLAIAVMGAEEIEDHERAN